VTDGQIAALGVAHHQPRPVPVQVRQCLVQRRLRRDRRQRGVQPRLDADLPARPSLTQGGGLSQA
jgi:hypothetical protein